MAEQNDHRSDSLIHWSLSNRMLGEQYNPTLMRKFEIINAHTFNISHADDRLYNGIWIWVIVRKGLQYVIFGSTDIDRYNNSGLIIH